jgi:hypothetical protein
VRCSGSSVPRAAARRRSRAGRGPPRSGPGHDHGRRRGRSRGEAIALRLHAPAGSAPPLAVGGRQRGARPPDRGGVASGGAGARRVALRAARARRLRAIATGRALRRDAPASRLPADSDGGTTGAAPRRAVRIARRDHEGGDAVVARRDAATRPPHRPPGHPDVEEALYWPTASWCWGRPASVVDRIEIEAPLPDRAAAVTCRFAASRSARSGASTEATR